MARPRPARPSSRWEAANLDPCAARRAWSTSKERAASSGSRGSRRVPARSASVRMSTPSRSPASPCHQREHEADQERRARPGGLLHQPAEQAYAQEHDDVAPVPRALVGRERHHHEQKGHEPRRGDEAQPRHRAREQQAGPGAHHVGQRQRPHDGERHGQVLADHRGARLDAEQDEPAQQHRGGAAARDAEQQRRDQRAALLGVVGALGADHAADVAMPEALGVAHALLGQPVGDPVDHAAAASRKTSSITAS